jgi:hypothetical protein
VLIFLTLKSNSILSITSNISISKSEQNDEEKEASKKINTPRSRKGQLQVKTTTVSTKSPNCRENIHKSNKDADIKVPLTENSLKNYTVFTSPGDELAGSWKLRFLFLGLVYRSLKIYFPLFLSLCFP